MSTVMTEMGMKCMECPHFRIMYWPIKHGREIWDTGLAKCKKHDLVVDFLSKQKLTKLTCVDEEKKECQKTKES